MADFSKPEKLLCDQAIEADDIGDMMKERECGTDQAGDIIRYELLLERADDICSKGTFTDFQDIANLAAVVHDLVKVVREI